MVKAIHISKQTYTRKDSFQSVARYCFISLIVLVFTILKLSPFLYANQPGTQFKKSSAIHIVSCTSQAVYSSASPHYSFSEEPDMEMIEEDEESKTKLENIIDHLLFANTSSEDIHSISLKSRFLQIQSSLQNRESIPFFLLYHSWKSYIS